MPQIEIAMAIRIPGTKQKRTVAWVTNVDPQKLTAPQVNTASRAVMENLRGILMEELKKAKEA